MALADGELDLGFSPPLELTNSYPVLSVIHERAYVYLPSSGVRRLQDDGSPDADWQLAAPVTAFGYAVSELPAGGLAVQSSFGLFFDYGDGTYTRIRGTGAGLGPATPLLPQDDGSLVVVLDRAVRKVRADGSVDPVFRIRPQLQAVGASSTSSGLFTAVTDHHGRYVLAGYFRTSAPAERLALMRLQADGSLDLDWNPAPELGLNAAGGSLNSLPLALAALEDDSVVVVFSKELVRIDAQGKVTQRIPNQANSQNIFAPPVVQPDGKIIFSGNFSKWGEVPVSGLIRLNLDGTLDPSFNVQMSGPLVDSMTLDTQGRLWLGGAFRTVNGVARPGVARVFAYTPDPTHSVAPLATISVAQPHVATDETLHLTAQIGGIPEPDLQWFRNGMPLAGATNRGLRLSLTNASEVGDFSLVASNSLGVQTLAFPTVTLARRSPRPGAEDLAFNRALTNFSMVTHLVPQADGRVLVGSGDRNLDQSLESALVGRLLPDGRLDSSFGQEGIVTGKGRVETLIPLAGGGLLVAGVFTELGGQPAYGLAELDRSGQLVPRPFPSLDIPHVSTALLLPNGQLMIAGRFTKVGEVPAYRLARLNSDLTLDTSFHSSLVDPFFVDAFALDTHGRVLIAGERPYSNVIGTNPPSLGLRRLLADGSADPAFHGRTNGVRAIFVEGDGKLLVGMPAVRLDEDGNVLTVFEDDYYPYRLSDKDHAFSGGPNHLMVRTSDGGVIYRSLQGFLSNRNLELWRWKSTGERDGNFDCLLASATDPVYSATAMAALPDDTLLLNMVVSAAVTPPTPEEARRLHRIPRDSDFSLRTKNVSAGQFHYALATQPGMSYEVYQRGQLTGGTAIKLGEYPGDGYVVDLQTPATGDATYLELRRH